MKQFTLISLFSGCGGMDLGFKQAGFEILWANDFFKEAVDTYKLNIGEHVVFGDITKIESSSIPNNPDVIIGGFPCQGFSIANNNRSMQDERNFLYKELLRVIKDKQPKFFVAENVKGLMSMENGEVLKMIIRDFEEIGYTVDYKLLNAAEYGVPQMRERIIIIGNRIGAKNPFPEKTHYIDKEIPGLEKCPTVADTLISLLGVRLSEEPVEEYDFTVYNHIAYTNVKDKFLGRTFDVNQGNLCDYLRENKKRSCLSNKQIALSIGEKVTKVEHWFRKDNKSGSIPSPDCWLKLKTLLNLDDTFDEQILTFEEKDIKYEQSLRITNWDRPSDTITATTPEIHIDKDRRLSVREVARLQTFPEDFIFTGKLDKMYRQVGNAVPVKLAYLIATNIMNVLKENE